MSVLATGSAFGRFIACLASSVLPRVWAESNDDSDGGRERHAFLERISNGMSPEASLELVHEDFRATCEEIDLDVLVDDLALAPEVTLAYNPATDTARLIGQGLDRDYSDVTFDELPMTLDLVGVDQPARRGTVKDYKSGWGRYVPPAPVNWQIKGGALALARLYDLDEVDGELIFLGGKPRDRAVFTASDFLLASVEMREAYDRALRAREAYARGEHVEPTEGPHCRYCPCAWSCPAKTGLIRAALGAPIIGVGEPIEPAELAKLWTWIGDAETALERLRKQVGDLVRTSPVRVSVAEDGTETWLGEVIEPGDERLDPQIALDVAAEILGEQPDDPAFLHELATIKVPKAGIERAIKARVPKGQGAAYLRRVLAEIRARDGASRPPTKSITTYTVRRPDGH